jgi:hypothetical protein
MPLKLLAPLYEDFELTRTDEKYGEPNGEPTTVTVKQAAQHEHERRQLLFSKLERSFSDLKPDVVTLVQDIPMEELKRLEVWLTLCESNILDENGKELFPSKKGSNGHPRLSMSQTAFNEAWGKLPPDVATEIHDKVLKVNKIWSGRSGEEF